MKFIFATGIFPPDIGGPATYTQKLTLELQKRGFEIKIITYSDSDVLKSQIPIIRISRRYPKGLRHLLYFWYLLWLAKDADVIYAQNVTSAGLPALLVSKLLKKKFILKIVGDAAWEQKKGYLKPIQRCVAKNCHQIIVPSQYVKKMVLGWGVPADKIEVIYNAQESLPSLDISKEEAKRKIGAEGDIILSVGRLSPWKGFRTLIEVMTDLLKENSNFKLLIVGEGEEKENLKFKIENLKLENNVKLVGKVSHSQAPLYLKAADVFVLNSEYEGLSHAILEAMQSGVPVVASRQGGNPELIEDNFNGFLIEYNNQNQLKEAILRIWRDKNFQDKFVQNSKEKLKNFTWENLVKKTIEILKS